MKHITIKDLAKELCISTSTVSRALADDKNIRRETKEKVLELAHKLGYRPNPVAANLKSGHSNTVGVIVPEMITPFASKVINGIQEVLYAHGIKVIIANSEEDPHKEKENLKLMERFMVDGIIISQCNYKQNKEEYERLQNAEMPMVFYDRIPHGLDVSQVLVDDYMKSFFLVEEMIRSGRKRIVHIKGPEDIYNSLERSKGYIDAMNKFHLSESAQIITASGMSFKEGERVADLLLDNNYHPDAVFAFTDTLAIGTLNQLRKRGKKIPDDIAIASFSGTDLSTIVYPPMSTVEPPLFQMGKQAAELIIEKIKKPKSPNRSIILNAEIKMRASVLKDIQQADSTQNV